MTIEAGKQLLHYRLVEKIGEGGMGQVWRAVDTTLDREVAIKILPAEFAGEAERLARFEREAKLVASLNHSNIAVVHGLHEAEGVHFLAMELVEGGDLSQRLKAGPLPPQEILRVGVQIAEALEAAHAKGVVHRDLKPGNIMIGGDGRVKVLDFGLARSMTTAGAQGPDDATATADLTRAGVVVGTVPYMAPEQIEGRTTDPRSDVFSLGIVLYEMIAGRRPFVGESGPAVMASILKDEPVFDLESRRDLPDGLLTLVRRCLSKDPSRRPADAGEVRTALRALLQEDAVPRTPPRLRWPLLIGAAVVVFTLLVAGWVLLQRNQALQMQAEALPRLSQLAFEGKYIEAFDLARDVERVAGADAVPDELWDKITETVSVTTEPPGAQITVQPFGTDREPWSIGSAPQTDVRVPMGAMHWRVQHEGYLPAELVSIYAPDEPFVLLPESERDSDMIRVPAAEVQLWAMGAVRVKPEVSVGPFLIDRHEVTNRAYAAFVEAGGYEKADYWKHPFHDGDQPLSFAQAKKRFKDATGRPGPSGWRLGSYPDGEENLPVTGVSWYEAAAYAEFAGKELPTVYHWFYADTGGDLQLLPGLYLPRSNFGAGGPRAAGDDCVMGAHGAHDMAGNVREWSASVTGPDRLALGGAWTDPSYVYLFPDVRSPFDREKENGFRCIRRLDDGELSPLALAPIESIPQRDYSTETSVSDEIYSTLVRFYDKEAVPLDPRIETTDDNAEHWIKQKVSFAAGYDGERLLAWLYLPRNAKPPYQTIIQMGGAGTFYRTSSETEDSIFGWSFAEYLLRGGRAVLLPLWKGSYERSDGYRPLEASVASRREHYIKWISELRYSVDYLQSRDDIDPERIGYQGISLGAGCAPGFLALEPRLRVGLIIVGGFPVLQFTSEHVPPEIDAFNFAPRVSVPVLMLNGRYDPLFPYESSQLPLFRTLGTPEANKRHATFPAGHSSSSWMDELIREGLDWLDLHFGKPRRG